MDDAVEVLSPEKPAESIGAALRRKARVKARLEREAAKKAARKNPPVSEAVVQREVQAEPSGRVARIDGATLEAFLQDYSFVTIVRGPWASGKSVASIMKMYQAAHLQLPNGNGVRKTRWAVVRNTYPDLQETTVKSWLFWFPEEVYGPMRRSRPFQHVIKEVGRPHNGKSTTIEMEVLFIALDDDEDRKKLLSMELTGVWINEAREISKPIIDDVIGRTGRYPPKLDGGHTWSGCIMDTNAPAETHWLPMMMGETIIPEEVGDDEREALKQPEDWHYYVQPGALVEVKDATGRTTGWAPNPAAENIRNLTDGYDYYLKRVGGKTLSWVRVNFANKLGTTVSGKPVWPTFSRERHVSSEIIPYDPNKQLYLGIDQTGRNPAAVLGQNREGGWKIISELVGTDISRDAFAPQVRRWLAKIGASVGVPLEGMTFSCFRDPHDEQDHSEGKTADQIYRKHGIVLVPAPSNGIKHRTETVETLFDNGKILISPNCVRLIAACEGGYRFRKLKISGGDFFDTEPDKRNGHADIADALQYLCLGAGEGRRMIGRHDAKEPVRIATRYRLREGRDDLWNRRKRVA